MVQARPRNGTPLELRLNHAKRIQPHGLTGIGQTCVFSLKWAWWHTRSYLPIVIVLLLSLGSLLVLQIHWLHRRLVYLPAREKAVLKDVG
ncbi:MAG: hypothetical protein KME45_03570 [Stenomitos rutilans HA7619-LM2]|jgi:hypothetical protein|nr:hypothetical protein [Stenomitos rutilans HA7619-LM2]